MHSSITWTINIKNDYLLLRQVLQISEKHLFLDTIKNTAPYTLNTVLLEDGGLKIVRGVSWTRNGDDHMAE